MSGIIGLITARGGSKAIPKKNVRLVAGKPLIAWTIEAAFSSHRLSQLVVSTDDQEIATIARKWGARVPFLRPAELALDNSPHIPVVVHAIEWLESHEQLRCDYVLLLQPTSPFRSGDDINNAIQLALDRDADSVVSVCESPSHPYLVKNIVDGRLKSFLPQPDGYLPRQSLPKAYVINGAIYLVRRDVLMKQHTFYTERTYAFLMPPERSLDIDTPWDIYLADLILRDRLES
jgi:N-acylneuraminate cytidylyltransferase/CMP-N,N'-diacetyllegionaminic acid synthase